MSGCKQAFGHSGFLQQVRKDNHKKDFHNGSPFTTFTLKL